MQFFDFGISQQVHSRWCRFIIHRYLGHLLETKLSLDQLSIDLVDGRVTLNDLMLNTQYINSALSSVNIPLKLVEGHIGNITIEVPWTAITKDATQATVSQLQLTFQAQERFRVDDRDLVSSMIGSVVDSLVSSVELAKEFCEQEKPSEEEFEGTDGVQAFTKVIDAIVSRFFVGFSDTIIRIESPPIFGTDFCTAIEVNIQNFEFMDEQMRACQQENRSAETITSQPHGIHSLQNLKKYITFRGISLHTDVFSSIESSMDDPSSPIVTSMCIRREKSKHRGEESVYQEDYSLAMSTMTTASAFQSCYSSLPGHEMKKQSKKEKYRFLSNPIKFAELAEETLVEVRINNADLRSPLDVHDSKVEIEVSAKALNIFIAPSQISILNRFFTNLTFQSAKEAFRDTGTEMNEKQIDIVLHTYMGEANNTTAHHLQGGNWSGAESFKEFSVVPLDDSNRSTQCDPASSAFQSLKNDGAGRKEHKTLHAKLGCLLLVICHEDLMDVGHPDHAKSIENLLRESEHFFANASKLRFNSNSPLADIRPQCDQLYPKDQLRIVAASISLKYVIESINGTEKTRLKFTLTNCDVVESLSPASCPGSSDQVYAPLFYFYRDLEDRDHQDHVKVEFGKSATSEENQIKVFVSKCRTEVDFSIIDRINHLFCPKPFFLEQSVPNQFGHLQQPKQMLKLSDELFHTGDVAQSGSSTVLLLECEDWIVDLRVPIVDLRSEDGRPSHTLRRLHPEYLKLNFKDVALRLPFSSSAEDFSLEVSSGSLIGTFVADLESVGCDKEEQLCFFFADKLFGEDTERVQVSVAYDRRNKSLKDPGLRTVDADEMSKSLSAPLIQSVPKMEGPFSPTHQSYTRDSPGTSKGSQEFREEDTKSSIVRAGSRNEMLSWSSLCMSLSDLCVTINVPILKTNIPNHAFLEILYNRMANDLALWQPSAPCFVKKEGLNDLKFDTFKTCKDESACSDDEAAEETASTNSEVRHLDRNRSHFISLRIDAKKCVLLMGTDVTEQNRVVGSGQICCDLSSACMFVVNGYHGNPLETYFFFTTTKATIAHCNSQRITYNLNKGEIGPYLPSEIQVERCNDKELIEFSEEDSISLALHLNMRSIESNVKDVLLAVSLRHLSVNLRPFRDAGSLWVTQIGELFNLQDYDIAGYEPPIVSTELHIHLDQLVLAYDHSDIVPESPLKLRAVIGQSDISSCNIKTMAMSEFLCIFEKTRMFITNESPKKGVKFEKSAESKSERRYIQVLDVGLFQLEVLLSLLPVEKLKDRTTPLWEIRCRNDQIKMWACADSLIALINMASEISESDAFSPLQKEDEDPEMSQSNFDDSKSEAEGSIWSKPGSIRKNDSVLTPEKEKQLQRMMESAIVEQPEPTTSSFGIAVAREAADELDEDIVISREERMRNLLTESIRESEDDSYHKRTVSLSTDDEFCMVDDVMGAGITGALGEPRIRVCGQRATSDDTGIPIDRTYFRIPDEVRTDGLAAVQDDFPPPICRYLIKDLSIYLHIFAGNDLGTSPDSPKSYSADDYREGMGRGQTVLDEERGGTYRDHSVSVVLELSKINVLYQLFQQDSPVMGMTLISIHDIIVKDCLHLSDINKLMYQYETCENPRRTCAPMLAIRMVETHKCEGKLRVSLLPVRLNIDQDTLEFIEDFVADVSSKLKLPTEAIIQANRPVIEVPAGVVSSKTTAERMYPELSAASSLNMQPLTPSPLAPSPLGDLSFFDQKVSSPVKRPLNIDHIDPMLTESAVSIGALFRGESRNTVDSPPLNSSMRDGSPPVLGDVSQDLMGCSTDPDLQGDWASDEIRFSSLHSPPMQRSEKKPSVDEMLMRSTMEESFHPDQMMSHSNGDQEERDTICGDDETVAQSTTEMEGPIRLTTFFKEFVFAPSTAIYIDYQGKQKVNLDRSGAVLGVIKGLANLNRTEIVLKEINCKNGLLGVDRCIGHALDEWREDILTNIPHVLASCGPISPLVQIGKGMYDLLWMPVSELRKNDGRVVKGLQKGAGSFGVSTAAALVEMAQTVVGVVQYAAETVFNEVNPRDPCLNNRNRRPIMNRPSAPTDLRHATQMAYDIVKDGVRQTRDDLDLASQENRASGQSAFRSWLRFATPAVVRPLVMGTQVTYQMLGGLKSQLRPDAHQDDIQKWKKGGSDGSSR